MCHVMSRLLLYGCSRVVLYLYIVSEAEVSSECSKCSKGLHLSLFIILMISSISIPKSWVWEPFLSLAPLPVGRQKELRIYCDPMWQILFWPAPWFILAWAWLGDEIYVLWGATASRAGESWVTQNSSLFPSTQHQNGGTRNWPFSAFSITQWNPPIGFKFSLWPWKMAQRIQIPSITDRSTLVWGVLYKAMQQGVPLLPHDICQKV